MYVLLQYFQFIYYVYRCIRSYIFLQDCKFICMCVCKLGGGFCRQRSAVIRSVYGHANERFPGFHPHLLRLLRRAAHHIGAAGGDSDLRYGRHCLPPRLGCTHYCSIYIDTSIHAYYALQTFICLLPQVSEQDYIHIDIHTYIHTFII